MSLANPLRYRISDWSQLRGIRSNTSGALSIQVSELRSEDIWGTRISIIHEELGPLFTYITNVSEGEIIYNPSGGVLNDLTLRDILDELQRFGFLVDFPSIEYLPEAQVTYLETINNLGYQKIRRMQVWHTEHGVKVFDTHIVGFNINFNTQWLNASYSAPEGEFLEGLRSGKVINITEIGDINNWDWSWLTFIARIDDILAEQRGTHEGN